MAEAKVAEAASPKEAVAAKPAEPSDSLFANKEIRGYVPLKTGAAATDPKAPKKPDIFKTEVSGVKPIGEHLPEIDFEKSANKRELTISSAPISIEQLAKNKFAPFSICIAEHQAASHFQDATNFGIRGAPAKAGEKGGDLTSTLVLKATMNKVISSFPIPLGVRIRSGAPKATGAGLKPLFPHTTSHNLADGKHHVTGAAAGQPLEFAYVIAPNEKFVHTGAGAGKVLWKNTQLKDPDYADERRWWTASAASLMHPMVPVKTTNKVMLPRDSLAASVAVLNQEKLQIDLSDQLNRSKMKPDSLEHSHLYISKETAAAMATPLLKIIERPRLADVRNVVVEFHPLVTSADLTPQDIFPHLTGKALAKAAKKPLAVDLALGTETFCV